MNDMDRLKKIKKQNWDTNSTEFALSNLETLAQAALSKIRGEEAG